MTAAWFDGGPGRTALRVVVLLHTMALLVLPKNFLPVRPEDLTGVLLLAAAGIAFVTAPKLLPSRDLAVAVAVYFAYFVIVLCTRDYPQGYYQATVFWFKEASYVAFAYVLWRAYRTDPLAYLNVAVLFILPNLVYGVYQLVTTPVGSYGVSPFGHIISPGSSGMLYFGGAAILLSRGILREALWARAGIAVLLVLVVAAGSRMALVGAITFFGFYLVQSAVRDRRFRSAARVMAFGAVVVAVTAWAITRGYASEEWSGLARYRGLLEPVEVIATRGIWFKVTWIDGPLGLVFGSGYSVPHVVPGEPYSYGMAMDNQGLYYLITGGIVSFALYLLLLGRIYRLLPAQRPEGMMVRALVVTYVIMGLGAEALQLSVHGNVFWMVVGIALAIDHWRLTGARREAAPA